VSARVAAEVELDVSHLPTAELSTGSLLWWGMLGFVAIEGLAFALLATAALYYRSELPAWPPPPLEPPPLAWEALGLLLLLASLVPIHVSERAAEQGDRARTLRWFALGTALGLGFLAIRIGTLATLPFRWSDHPYGSLVWTTLGFHLVHVGTELLESLVVIGLLVRGYWRDEQRLSLVAGGAYWDFVVLAWIPMFAVVFLLPRL
jgi:cytochrome c oxidase subunit 1/cytochrome c oxidase subunit I+III